MPNLSLTQCPCGQIITTGRADKKYCNLVCLRNYRKSYYKPGDRAYHKWTTSEMRFVQNNLSMTNQYMAVQLGMTTDQVESFRKRNKLRRVYEGV